MAGVSMCRTPGLVQADRGRPGGRDAAAMVAGAGHAAIDRVGRRVAPAPRDGGRA
ncbi:MAG: hypothetical protein GW886_04555 [Rhodobacterales bacterium]|nr:hypothetical protein [Rhodobacterales bacterium]